MNSGLRNVNCVAMIGAGPVGLGWTARFLARGLRVKLWAPESTSSESIADSLDRMFASVLKLGSFPKADRNQVELTREHAKACSGADWIQFADAPLDSLDTLTLNLERTVQSDVVIAINARVSSTEDSTSRFRFPQRMAVAQPWSAVHLTPLVELGGLSRALAGDASKIARTYYESVGMFVVTARDSAECVLSDRLHRALVEEAQHLVDEGLADAQTVSDVLTHGPGLTLPIVGLQHSATSDPPPSLRRLRPAHTRSGRVTALSAACS